MQQLQEVDLLCIQEHWLFQFELKFLEDFHQNFECHSKAVDMDDPIPPIQKPRGYAGTGILYKSNIKVKKLKDGDHRICCLEVLGEQPTIVVSVYMPAKGSKARDEEFEITLAGLEEVISRYKQSHQLIIAGDFNASLKTKSPDARDQKFSKFVVNNLLSISADHPDTPTYLKPDGTECSSLDYILVTEEASTRNTQVKLTATNTSDHRPVHTEYALPPGYVNLSGKPKVTTSEKNPAQKKAKGWKKVDTDEYRRITEREIESLNFTAPKSSWEASNMLKKISNILTACKDALTPSTCRRHRKPTSQLSWTPAIKLALSEQKKHFYLWKEAGRPNDKNHPLVIAKQEAKKRFRSEQRKQNASKFNEDMKEIAEAKAMDSRIFHRLVKLRSHTKVAPKVTELIVDGQKYTGDEVACGWYKHFSKLAKPEETNDEPGPEWRRDVLHITDICDKQEKLGPVSRNDVTAAIKDLNKNKANDINGLAAEHLQFCSSKIITILTDVINFFRLAGYLPDQHKVGKLFPVYKKLQPENPFNHRGITVLGIFSKVYEKLLKPSSDPILLPTQNKLQRGFTDDTSPLLAGLMLQEQIYEAIESGSQLFITMLDVKTAFDVVWHDSLLRKIYIDGIQGGLWLNIRSLYMGAQTAISWAGKLTECFPVLQGVRQGAVMSSDLYKRYNNPLLNMLSDSGLGGHIGNTPLQSPTCADDIALCGNDRIEMQSMIDVVHKYSLQEKYETQARKSAVLAINSPHPLHPDSFLMGESQIPTVEIAEHLGVLRDSTGGPNAQIQNNVKKARGAAYSLMGAGLHGKNGLPQDTCLHLYKIHILPVLTYGLGIFSLKEKSLEPLEHFQKTMIKQIISLADNVADPAVNILSGIPPVEFEVHRQALGYLGSIARKDSSAEYSVAKRQLIMKNVNSPSWFNYIKSVCIKYDLPTPREVLDQKPTKSKWKHQVNSAVTKYWKHRLVKEASGYPSLKFLNIHQFIIGKPHTIIRFNTTLRCDIIKCKIKLSFVTGTYSLQAHRSKFNQFDVKPTCLLCDEGPETREHFLTTCEKLDAYRSIYTDKIRDVLSKNLGSSDIDDIMNSREGLTQLLMDCTSDVITSDYPLLSEDARELELLSQKLIYALHLTRKRMLSILAPLHRRKAPK